MLVLLAIAPVLAAPSSIEELDLDGLLDLFAEELDAEVEVASRSAAAQREAPGLVTVLTQEDLRRAGCRDLMDALRLLPGLDFSGDVWNTTVPIVRGVLGEARVLVLVDGHEWNELLYGATTMGNRLPAYLIERIEVIRGPGSALYGGYAELAVVRVVTRGGGAFDGGRVDGFASWLPSGAYGRQTLGTSLAAGLGENGRIGVSAGFGRGRRSDDPYSDIVGNTIEMVEASALNPNLVSAELKVGRFEAALMGEAYLNTRQDGGARVDPEVRRDDYYGVYARASQVLPLSPQAALRARLSSKWQAPWQNWIAPPASYNYFLERADRTIAGLDFAVEDALPIDLLLGVEGGLDRGHVPAARVAAGFVEAEHVTYGLGAAFFQGVVPTEVVDLTAGVRLDANSAYGAAVSPRVVLTQAWERFHYKAGVARSYRAPGIVQARSDVDPEHTTTLEAELGVGPTGWAYLTVSAFDVSVTDVLVYFYEYDPVTGDEFDGYINSQRTGSRGGEAELRLLNGPLGLVAGYGFATTAGKNDVPDYAVPNADTDAVLAALEHKGVARVDVDPTDWLVLGATTTVLGPRWAVVGRDSGGPISEQLPVAVLIGAVADVEVPGVPGLTIGFVGQDLLDRNPPLAQAYDGRHLPLPGPGRELGVHVSWER